MNRSATFTLIALLALAACQSTPTKPVADPSPATAATSSGPAVAPAVPPAVPPTIQADRAGFSPLASNPQNTITLDIRWQSPTALNGWTVDLLNETNLVVRTFSGADPSLPPSLAWDGRDGRGQLVEQGPVHARLTAKLPSGDEVVDSPVFFVDTVPPSGTVVADPPTIASDDGTVPGTAAVVTMSLDLVPGGAPIVKWRLGVLHPDGRRFIDFISEDHRDNTISWNGRSLNNNTLEPGITYDLVATVIDLWGNTGTIRGTLTAAANREPEPTPVTVTMDGQVLATSQIYFPAYSSDLNRVDARNRELNQAALRTVAQALSAAQGSRVSIVGHANQVYWQDPIAGKAEQEAVLIPLSLARAKAVRDALVAEGLDSDHFAISGVGAEGPVAAFGDPLNNWRNRRVEFVVNKVAP